MIAHYSNQDSGIRNVTILQLDDNADGTWFFYVALPSGLVVDFVIYAPGDDKDAARQKAIFLAARHIRHTWTREIMPCP